MYNIKKIIIFLVVTVFFFPSCDSYLEINEEEALTFEKIWQKRSTIERYLSTVWGYIPDYVDTHQTYPFYGSSDEAAIAYVNRGFVQINKGLWNPSDVPNDRWKVYYRGIREANIFLKYAPTVDLEAVDIAPATMKQWMAEARFLRAFIYFELCKIYGPVILVEDELIDYTKPNVELYRSRNTWKECVDYIVMELEACANEFKLEHDVTVDYGRPTKGCCYAIISALKLYDARPLFNGNILYKDIKNQDGTLLFPGIETEIEQKWRDAADAAKRVIDLNIYELYKEYDGGKINPYKSIQNLYVNNWNKEIIFGRFYKGQNRIKEIINPRVSGGSGAWGALGPTQEQVDAYAMANGYYPITGYQTDGSPIVDSRSGYPSNEFAQSYFEHPLDAYGEERRTPRMYIDREPRFYASVLWSGCRHPFKAYDVTLNYAYGGNCGPGNSENYPPSGYSVRKYINPDMDTKNGKWGTQTFPYFRYAEVLLNYIEALNEYDPGNTDIITYLNEIRERAGVPKIESIYPEAVGNKDLMRELIRKERRVELAFERRRYFDTRTWMISHETDKGDKWGMNASSSAPSALADQTPSGFWKRTVFQTRVFKDAYYLYPISQDEINRNPLIVQNYGW